MTEGQFITVMIPSVLACIGAVSAFASSYITARHLDEHTSASVHDEHAPAHGYSPKR